MTRPAVAVARASRPPLSEPSSVTAGRAIAIRTYHPRLGVTAAAEAEEFRRIVLDAVGRVPAPATVIIERVREYWGDDAGERRIWRALRRLLERGLIRATAADAAR